MAVKFRRKAAAQIGGVAPGRRPGVEQAQHVRRQTQAVMQMRIAGQVEHRAPAVGAEPGWARLDRVAAQPQPDRWPRACSMARHTFSGVHGGSISVTPRGLSASTTALTTAGVEPMVALSPTPLTPSGLMGLGVIVRSSTKLGRSGPVGII